MHFEAAVRDRLMLAAEHVDEPWEPAIHDVMERVSTQRRKAAAGRVALAAGALVLAWLAFASRAGPGDVVERTRPEPASSPVTTPDAEELAPGLERVPGAGKARPLGFDRPAPAGRKGTGSGRLKGTGTSETTRDTTDTSDGPRAVQGNGPEMTRDYAGVYETPPVTAEIDRRSGCSLTYTDCISVRVDPEEASFRVSAVDSEHRLVLIRIEQWGGGTTVTEAIYTCSDEQRHFPLHPETETLDISFEQGSCPDGRRAGASRGSVNVAFYEGTRPK